jgi:hypothetical protein
MHMFPVAAYVPLAAPHAANGPGFRGAAASSIPRKSTLGLSPPANAYSLGPGPTFAALAPRTHASAGFLGFRGARAISRSGGMRS